MLAKFIVVPLWVVCLYTGWLLTWPLRHLLYARYRGNEMAGLVCGACGAAFWIILAMAYLVVGR